MTGVQTCALPIFGRLVRIAEIEAEAIREVDEAADYALSSPFPAPETAVTDVYAPSEWNADGRLR